MTIQWFPGHMTKTTKLIKDSRSSVDVYLELLDARAPISTRNPLLDQLIGDKARVVILNKIDIADSMTTTAWKARLEQEVNTRVVLVSSKERLNLAAIVLACQQATKSKVKSLATVRAMIVGIPNVGKSTLINALCHGHKVSVAPKPGHTKTLQKIRLSENFELVDSPGILWHKFDDPLTGQRLAMLGAIKDDVYDFSIIVDLTISFLLEHYPTALKERYKLTGLDNNSQSIIQEIGNKRGFLVKGGLIDLERTQIMLMNDFRSGALGKFSLEHPGH